MVRTVAVIVLLTLSARAVGSIARDSRIRSKSSLGKTVQTPCFDRSEIDRSGSEDSMGSCAECVHRGKVLSQGRWGIWAGAVFLDYQPPFPQRAILTSLQSSAAGVRA